MLIGGLQPVTLLDYPQKVAAIIFTVGCNMRCPFCYNPSLVLSSQIEKVKTIKEIDIINFLKKRLKYLDGVVITGGEPTLQSDLFSFCQKLKKIGYLVKLDTNGLRPEVLKKILDNKLIDYIAMDIKGSEENYNQAAGVKIDFNNIKKSIALILGSGLPHEFRSTLVRGLHSSADVVKMSQLVSGADKYFLQGFRKNRNLVDPYFSGRNFSSKIMNEFKDSASAYVEACETR
ncbi:MAG: anaerobic ribonucleoside-triphosphate reductase activating protein [Candidatus Buchananbacteria bacterium]|nr:anaerobic ribonucleoside-triphosphate reductase activating protein [Candidatus Buchananbacteria bacterium]